MKTKDPILLSDHFTYKRILRFAFSPILMMVFTSLYGIVDGFFISNYAGLDEYAGVNLIMPIIMIIGGIGFMFGSGGSALCGKLLGEKKKEEANKVFGMIILITIIVGLVTSLTMFFFIKPICEKMGSITSGSNNNMVKYATVYGRILILGQVFFMLQGVFHGYLILDEKPRLAFIFTLISGLSNMILDLLFVGIFKWGVSGASVATILGYIISTLCSLTYFIRKKDGNINLKITKLELKPIMQCCFNGSSEFVNNISSSITGLIFNIQLLKYYGQNGISAYGTIMYVCFIFVAVSIGFSISLAPVISYNYGAKNNKELSNVLNKSLVITLILSLLMFISSELLGPLFAKLYLGKDEILLSLTKLAFKIVSIEFLFCGFSIFISSFFTALNNGLISALISFLRTLVIQVSFVFILPLLIGSKGIWWSIVVAEFVAWLLSFMFLFIYKTKYNYSINMRVKYEN